MYKLELLFGLYKIICSIFDLPETTAVKGRFLQLRLYTFAYKLSTKNKFTKLKLLDSSNKILFKN